MDLIGQAEPEWWERLISNVGVPGACLILLALALWRVAPKVGAALVAYLENARDVDRSNQETLRKLTDTTLDPRGHVSNMAVKESLSKAADAAEAALNHAPEGLRREVMPHVRAMREAVG